jgi:polar amino acid transport system substrate-binding protein
MRKSKWGALVAIALISIVALLGVVACGGGKDEGASGGVSPTATAEMTATELWTNILGHEPTGLAAKVLDRGKMTVANDSNYAPFSSLNDAGELVGFDVDVAKRVGEVLKVDVGFVNPAWDTIPTGLVAGRFDVSIGTMTPTTERRQSIDFTQPYFWGTQQLIILKGAPKIETPGGLKGKKIACSAASTPFYFLQKLGGVNIKTYDTDLNALPDLKNGRVDGLVTSGAAAMGVVASGEPFEFSGDPLFYEQSCFAVAKGESDWLALMDWAVATMHKDGSLSEMSKSDISGIDLTQTPPAGVEIVGD